VTESWLNGFRLPAIPDNPEEVKTYMARTALTKTTAPGTYPTAGTTLTWNDADSANGNDFSMTGRDLVLVRNNHATDPKTYTVTSAADAQGRTKDITAEALAAGTVVVLGPFRNKTGWSQSGNKFYINGEDNNIKIAVVLLP
jgi:hypothetical protein